VRADSGPQSALASCAARLGDGSPSILLSAMAVRICGRRRCVSSRADCRLLLVGHSSVTHQCTGAQVIVLDLCIAKRLVLPMSCGKEGACCAQPSRLCAIHMVLKRLSLGLAASQGAALPEVQLSA
jgi:hypothetical protein